MEERLCSFCGKPIRGRAFRERSSVTRFAPLFFHHECGKKYFESVWKTHFRWYGLSRDEVLDFYRYVDESLNIAFEEVVL